MRKLELKDICGYLPYGLQVICDNFLAKVESLGQNYNVDGDMSVIFIGGGQYLDYGFPYLDDIKPLLHPMSDLTKPIIVKGYNDDKEFVPIEKIIELGIFHESIIKEYILGDKRCSILENMIYYAQTDVNIMFMIFDFFNQCHFDYRNIIGQGLAIDINTIK